jgi:Na+/H+ antiporter NhaD/arsenite permease-like protein
MKFITTVYIAKIGSLLLVIQSLAKIIINFENPVSLNDHVNIGNSIFQLIGFGCFYIFFTFWHKRLKE